MLTTSNMLRFSKITSLTIGLILAGCSAIPPTSSEKKPTLQSTLPPKSIDINDQGIKQVAEANNQFAIDMFQQLYKEDSKINDNVFYSPYSLSTAMAMIYDAAAGQTQAQIRQTFHYPELSVLHNSSAQLHQHFNQPNKPYRLMTNNGLWLQQDLQPNPAFINNVTNYYGAAITPLDFKNQPEASKNFINQKIANQTDDMIKELLPNDSIESDTVSVLTNAVYFKGDWTSPFRLEYQPETFYTFDQKNPKLTMMSGNRVINYFENDTVQMAEIPYKGDDLSMLVILPKDKTAQGLKRLVNDLSTTRINGWLANTSVEETAIKLPKFKLEKSYKMKDALSQMGMPIAFSNAADFNIFNNAAKLSIDGIFHKAVIQVDEKGTVAAAATGMDVVLVMDSHTAELIANHPFVFIIRDKKTNTFLFIGQVSQP